MAGDGEATAGPGWVSICSDVGGAVTAGLSGAGTGVLGSAPGFGKAHQTAAPRTPAPTTLAATSVLLGRRTSAVVGGVLRSWASWARTVGPDSASAAACTAGAAATFGNASAFVWPGHVAGLLRAWVVGSATSVRPVVPGTAVSSLGLPGRMIVASGSCHCTVRSWLDPLSPSSPRSWRNASMDCVRRSGSTANARSTACRNLGL